MWFYPNFVVYLVLGSRLKKKEFQVWISFNGIGFQAKHILYTKSPKLCTIAYLQAGHHCHRVCGRVSINISLLVVCIVHSCTKYNRI